MQYIWIDVRDCSWKTSKMRKNNFSVIVFNISVCFHFITDSHGLPLRCLSGCISLGPQNQSLMSIFGNIDACLVRIEKYLVLFDIFTVGKRKKVCQYHAYIHIQYTILLRWINDPLLKWWMSIDFPVKHLSYVIDRSIMQTNRSTWRGYHHKSISLVLILWFVPVVS